MPTKVGTQSKALNRMVLAIEKGNFEMFFRSPLLDVSGKQVVY